MNELPSPLSRSVRAELRAAEISQEKVGSVLGITQESVSRRFRGKTAWRAEELMKISHAFKIPLERLYETRLTTPAPDTTAAAS